MRRWTKWLLLAGFALVAVAQVVPIAGTNPPADPAHAISAMVPVPPVVVGILERACQDCHSNRTVWPWYGKVAPISWLVVNDVNEGRHELNLSDWARYTPRRQDRKLKEICEQVERGEMPMRIYTVVHPQAKLTASDRKAICDWSTAARKRMAATATSAAAR